MTATFHGSLRKNDLKKAHPLDEYLLKNINKQLKERKLEKKERNYDESEGICLTKNDNFLDISKLLH